MNNRNISAVGTKIHGTQIGFEQHACAHTSGRLPQQRDLSSSAMLGNLKDMMPSGSRSETPFSRRCCVENSEELSLGRRKGLSPAGLGCVDMLAWLGNSKPTLEMHVAWLRPPDPRNDGNSGNAQHQTEVLAGYSPMRVCSVAPPERHTEILLAHPNCNKS